MEVRWRGLFFSKTEAAPGRGVDITVETYSCSMVVCGHSSAETLKKGSRRKPMDSTTTCVLSTQPEESARMTEALGIRNCMKAITRSEQPLGILRLKD